MIQPTQHTRRWLLGVLCVGLAAIAGLWNNASEGQTQPKPPNGASTNKTQPRGPKDRDLQAFMRKKLAASSEILEGLCTEDLNLVAQGARKLHEMSEAERWHVSNDVMYKQFSNEYRQITQDLIKAAEEDKFDRATLKWLDATVSCLDCHRFVRGIRIVETTSKPDTTAP